MSRAIWLLAFLLIANWFFQWKLAEWKVREVQKASQHIEKKIDEVATELDNILLQYMEDPKALQRVKQHLNDR